ncbi:MULTISPECIES: glycine-rich domain-containing protein [Nocardia]|uniref:glycine-rich domain-containing protein n=1 Tax=Nocardia TaxID=1817 RepID=UPI0007A54C3F|nr:MULTISPECIES: hypothetical protein [Nocardia]
MGVTPNQNRPDGAFAIANPGSHQYGQQGLSETVVLRQAANGARVSFAGAQNVHNRNVVSAIQNNTNQIGSSGQSLVDHENRILKLENGDVVSVFYTSDNWIKPNGFNYHRVILIGAGGGGGGGQDGGSLYGGQGGGQGGWDERVYTEAELVLNSYAVSIGSAGAGAYGSFVDAFDRPDNLSLGPNWRADSGSLSNRILNGVVEIPTFTSNVARTGRWNSWVAGELLTDNARVVAKLTPPAASLALDNVTGVILAVSSTLNSASKMVAFVSNANSSCGIFTQVGAPVSPYIANGLQAGQTVVAVSTSKWFGRNSTIALERRGNVFTGYIDDAEAVSWTDVGNTVPTGPGNRSFGILTEGNWPTFAGQYHSLGIDVVQAMHLDPLPGGSTTFSGGTITQVAGGGAAGLIYGIDDPAARGSGNKTVYNASGGAGGNNSLGSAGLSGGGGVGLAGGGGGKSDGQPGSDGKNLTTGKYGVGSGGGGGANGGSGNGGLGGAGGFPGAAGGGGGSTSVFNHPGGGGNGANGMAVIISSINPPA